MEQNIIAENLNSNIVITDLNNNVINNGEFGNIPFVIVRPKSENIKLLKKISSTNQSSIWTLKYNIDGYNILGHLWVSRNVYNEFEGILLAKDMTQLKTKVNNIVTEYPVDYHLVSTYSDGYIWRPICKNGYIALGMLFAKEKPNLYDCVTIISCNTLPYNGWYNVINNITNMNEYNLLWYNLYDRLTLDTDRIVLFDTELIKQQRKILNNDKQKKKYHIVNDNNRRAILVPSDTPWFENNKNITENSKNITENNKNIIKKQYNEIIYDNTKIPSNNILENFTDNSNNVYTKRRHYDFEYTIIIIIIIIIFALFN